MRATRPVTISFIEGDSCTFDSNEFVEWEILTDNLPMGEIVFKGSLFTNEGLKQLGRCTFDYCDHGLYVFQDLGSMLYEAKYPWLDYRDAIKKKAFDFKGSDISRLDEQFLYMNEDGRLVVTDLCSMKRISTKVKIEKFKPLSLLEWINFQEIKAYTPL